MTLYELTGQLLTLQEMLEGGDCDEQTLNDTIESIDALFEDKADGYAKIIRNFESDIEGIKAEEKRLADRRKALENSIGRLKGHLETSMIELDRRKFKTQLFSFAIQANPAKVVVDDESALDPRFLIPQPAKVDRKLISDVIKAGGEVAGAHLEKGESLRIR